MIAKQDKKHINKLGRGHSDPLSASSKIQFSHALPLMVDLDN